MAGESLNVIVLKDSDGNYYALAEDSLAQARVPDEHRGEIEELIGAGSGPSDLSTGQLESVVGGGGGSSLTSLGSFKVPSQIAENLGRSQWSSRGV